MGILEVKGVNKRFGGLQALGDVNLSVAENSVHAIIGPNGAGKSTLLNCLVGMLIPDSGSVTFQGESVLGRNPHEINQMGISRVFQTPEIFGDRRLEMAMCLVQQPKLLLLDEPTAGMARADTNNTIDLLKEIHDSRDITMAIIEHDMHVVFSLAERITVLAQGSPLVEETPENIKGHPKVREAYLGEAQV